VDLNKIYNEAIRGLTGAQAALNLMRESLEGYISENAKLKEEIKSLKKEKGNEVVQDKDTVQPRRTGKGDNTPG